MSITLIRNLYKLCGRDIRVAIVAPRGSVLCRTNAFTQRASANRDCKVSNKIVKDFLADKAMAPAKPFRRVVVTHRLKSFVNAEPLIERLGLPHIGARVFKESICLRIKRTNVQVCIVLLPFIVYNGMAL